VRLLASRPNSRSISLLTGVIDTTLRSYNPPKPDGKRDPKQFVKG